MGYTKQYMAFYTDWHDNGQFTFYSTHRANSNPNLDDAYAEARKRYGNKRAKAITITNTMRWHDGE